MKLYDCCSVIVQMSYLLFQCLRTLVSLTFPVGILERPCVPEAHDNSSRTRANHCCKLLLLMRTHSDACTAISRNVLAQMFTISDVIFKKQVCEYLIINGKFYSIY